MDAGLHLTALPIFKELLDRWPGEYRFGIHLVNCYQELGKITEARTLLEELFERKKQKSQEAVVKLKEFIKGHKDVPLKDLGREDQRKLRMLRAEASRSPYATEYLLGSLLFAEGNENEAITHLMKAEKARSRQPDLHVKLGNVYLKMKRWPDAERSFREALAIDSDYVEAHLGLCQIYLNKKRNTEAAEAALSAVGLRFHHPKGHFLLGVALHRIGRIEQAIEALSVAISQNPYYPTAYRRLAYIYRHRLRDNVLAEKYRALAEESSERIKAVKNGAVDQLMGQEESGPTALTSSHIPSLHFLAPDGPLDLTKTVIIVSGLPRSGTSMMMQMLDAGGIPPLTDGLRKPDESNPRGYFEYEKAKQLRRDASWLPEARGKAVKIVAQLLPSLPLLKDINYFVIFMERNMEAVALSQREMLHRQGKPGATLPDQRLKNVFSRQLRQTKLTLATRKIPVIFVDYDRTLKDPLDTIKRLKAIFGPNINEKRMAEAVDPRLRHQVSRDSNSA